MIYNNRGITGYSALDFRNTVWSKTSKKPVHYVTWAGKQRNGSLLLDGCEPFQKGKTAACNNDPLLKTLP